MAPSKLSHFPCSRRGIVSTTIKAVKHKIPPPPAPCTVRPTSMLVKLLEDATTTEPMKNSTRLASIKGLRPNICDNDPIMGWNTVDARRNDVPLQNASTAEPARALAITFSHFSNQSRKFEAPKGLGGLPAGQRPAKWHLGPP